MNAQFKDVKEAQEFLKKLGAPPRLIRHVYLVGEAADLLIAKLSQMGISFDASFVRLGVLFHDAGKILHPEELVAKGNQHEPDGETFLIRNGIDPRLARCCKSHGQWKTMECSLEELLVAASDKLWKGKREVDLEKEIIERLSKLVNQDYWELFIEMDSYFEMIAANGHSEGKRLKGKGEREEEIVLLDCNLSLVEDLLEGGGFKPVQGERKGKLYAYFKQL